MQLIKKFNLIFQNANLKIYLRPYDIIAITPDSGTIGRKKIFSYLINFF